MILTAELTDMVVEKLAEGQNLCFMVVQSYYGVTEKKTRIHLPHPSSGFLARPKILDIDQKYIFTTEFCHYPCQICLVQFKKVWIGLK